MNFKPAQMESYFNSPGIGIKCIVLFGNNEGEIASLQKKCAEAVCGDVKDAFRYTSLEMEKISKDGQEIYAEFFAQSLIGGRRAIVVKNIDNTLLTILKNMIPETNSENLLILTSSSLNTKSSLITWAKDRDDVIIVGCYEDREENIADAANKMLKEYGLSADVPVLQVLCSRLSPDRKVSQSEIDKLAMYIGDRKNVEIEDVLSAISDVAGASYEDLCYYIAGGDVLKSCNMYNRLINEGEEPASIVRQISYHFFKLLSCVAILEKGASIDETIRSLRPPLMFYRKKSFEMQLKVWNKERLFSVLNMLYECERDCKSTNFPAEQCVSYTIMRISGAVKKFH